MILLHGTTRKRADRIVAGGPRVDYLEPGEISTHEGFSTYVEGGPYMIGPPEEYARRKAALFPAEGPPVVLIMDVPDEIVARAVDEFLPLSRGLVQFNQGAGIEELRSAWPTLVKQIRELP